MKTDLFIRIYGIKKMHEILSEYALNNPKIPDADNKRVNIPELTELKPYIESFKVYARKDKGTGKQGVKSAELPHPRKMTIEDIKGVSRKSEIVTVRYCLFAYYRQFYSLKRIGSMFRKDHTTIIHGYNTHLDKVDIGDPATVEAWQKLQDYVKHK